MAATAFGVTFRVEATDDALLARAAEALPPSAEPAELGEAARSFAIADDTELGDLEAAVRSFVAEHAPGHVFVHAGVVAVDGRAIVLPARTQAGKTTLVVELLRAGATYYSDELAVLDPDGRVLPYPQRLSLRPTGTRPTAAELGAPTGEDAVPVAVVARTEHVPGAEWAPEVRSAADGALLLMAHAGQVRREPERVLETTRRAAEQAVVLEGPRGEAAAVAADLLARARRAR
jgi:hypothetical protein